MGRRRNRGRRGLDGLLDTLGMDVDVPSGIRQAAWLFWAHTGGRRGALVLELAATAVARAAQLAAPAVVAAAVDGAIAGRLGWQLWAVAGVSLGALAENAVAGPARAEAEAHTSRSLRQRFIGHAIALGVPGRRRFEHGDLLDRFTGDAARLATFGSTVWTVATTIAVAFGAVVALTLVDWALAAVVLVAIPAASLAFRRLIVDFGDHYRAYREHTGELVARLVDALAGRRTIRACGTVDREIARVLGPLEPLAAASERMVRGQAQGQAANEAADHGLRIAVIAVSAVLLARGRITPGELLAALGYAQLAYGSVFELLNTGLFRLAMTKVNAARTSEVLVAPPATPPPSEPVHPVEVEGTVELVSVTVAADDGPILDGIDLVIPAGTTVALVGRSGAGKSSIATLVGRLLDPDAGTVRLDGVDLRDVDPAWLRRTVTYAFERPALLGRTIADTIAYGEGVNGAGTSAPRVRAAATVAAADSFIDRLPDGYATPIDEAPLSGGERQRIGLARAALRDAPVVVLDDATSSLDVATEARVFASFEAITRERTTLIVAHRASTAARADLVAWLDGGRIRSLAPHHELWHDPAYRAVFSS